MQLQYKPTQHINTQKQHLPSLSLSTSTHSMVMMVLCEHSVLNRGQQVPSLLSVFQLLLVACSLIHRAPR